MMPTMRVFMSSCGDLIQTLANLAIKMVKFGEKLIASKFTSVSVRKDSSDT